MIYRLWNTAENRYATAEEMKFLRVNAEGKVESLFTDVFDKEIYAGTELRFWDLVDWVETTDWEVEWLCYINGVLFNAGGLIERIGIATEMGCDKLSLVNLPVGNAHEESK